MVLPCISFVNIAWSCVALGVLDIVELDFLIRSNLFEFVLYIYIYFMILPVVNWQILCETQQLGFYLRVSIGSKGGSYWFDNGNGGVDGFIVVMVIPVTRDRNGNDNMDRYFWRW